MQDRTAVAQRMPASGRQDPRNIVLRYCGADELNLCREQFACRPPRRYRQHHGFDFDRSHSFGRIHGATDGVLSLHQVDDGTGLCPARNSVAETDHLNGMAAAGQNLLRATGTKPADQANDFARADVERRNHDAAARRDRPHLRGHAMTELVHASPPFFFFALALSASSRACVTTSDKRTVTRSGRRRSILVMSRDSSFLSWSNLSRRSSAAGRSFSGRRTSMPFVSRKFQRRSATSTEALSAERISGKRSKRPIKSLARRPAPLPTTSGNPR